MPCSDEEQPRQPKHVPAPLARMTCVDNDAELELTSHRQAKAAHAPVTQPPHTEKRKATEIETLSSPTERESDPESQPKKKASKGKCFRFIV